MKRFPLLFLAAGLVSCAPLPPLVTDPPAEKEPSSSSSAEDLEAPRFIPPANSPTDSTVQDSVEAFSPIAPDTTDSTAPDSAVTESAPKALAQNHFQAFALPKNLARDFRVGILVGASKANISGAYRLAFHESDSTASISSDKISLSASGRQVQFRSEKADSVWIFPIEDALISVEGKSYRGKILVVNSGKKLNVINVLPIEDYLKGVVPHEIGKLDESMIEALKVQAVAARTYAYRHYNSRASLGFDVYATVQDQVYQGSAGETELTNAAIDATKGVVLTSGENFIEAYYHSTCGGYTDGVEVWGLAPVPYLKSQSDMNADSAWCSASSYTSWKKVYSEKELLSMFRANFGEAKAVGKSSFGGIQQIEVKSTFPGGRIAELEVLTDKGIFTVKGDRIRWLFKERGKILPSSKFQISKNGKVWVLDGSGFGHGIGMCQMGARARAKAGQNFQEILEAYYPGAELQCVNEQ